MTCLSLKYPQNNHPFTFCSLCNILCLNQEIVKLHLQWGGVEKLGVKDLLILFYAYRGWEEILLPPERRLSPAEETGAPRDAAAARIPGSWELGLVRINTKCFNLAPEFTWLCHSNYLARLGGKNAIMETIRTHMHTRYEWL